MWPRHYQTIERATCEKASEIEAGGGVAKGKEEDEEKEKEEEKEEEGERDADESVRKDG